MEQERKELVARQDAERKDMQASIEGLRQQHKAQAAQASKRFQVGHT